MDLYGFIATNSNWCGRLSKKYSSIIIITHKTKDLHLMKTISQLEKKRPDLNIESGLTISARKLSPLDSIDL